MRSAMTVRYSRKGVEMALKVKKLASLCLCRIMERSEIIYANVKVILSYSSLDD